MTTKEIRQRVLDNRLWRIASRTGYRLYKDGDRFLLTSLKTGAAVLGLVGNRPFTATRAEVKAFLEQEDQERHTRK